MTNQPKWTPGPWHVVNDSPNIRGSVGHKVAEVNIGFDFLIHCRSSIEPVYNSYLIAAAPELYGAAQLALQIAEDTIRSEFEGSSSSQTFNAMMAELDPVRFVLSKARGEAQ